MDKTRQIIAEMLQENTGRHFLDSGGAYGRNWERNQGRNFEAEPRALLSFKWDYIEVSLNVFHWLAERLEFDSGMDSRFQAFADERPDDGWIQIMEDFADHLAESGHEIGGIYGDGDPFTVNTYNHESLLSQTLQYTYLTVDGEAFVILQIHGGCDVRGGYTAPRVFRECGEVAMLEDQRASIYVESSADRDNQGELFEGMPRCEPMHWDTDDGYHWYADGGTADRTLNSYEISTDPDHCGDGEHIFRDDDGNGYCPHTGRRLLVDFY